MKLSLFLTGPFLLPIMAFASTWYVPDDYPTIQDAINASVAGDTVIVRPGKYYGNIDFIGKAITVKSESGSQVTIIDGNQTGSVVYFTNGEGADTILEGFTITNGNGTWCSSYMAGGGIYCVASSPIITGNMISGNSTGLGSMPLNCYGGGIFCGDHSSPTISNNIIINNTLELSYWSSYGAGIYCLGLFSTISNNTISQNSSVWLGGGGISSFDSSLTIINNTISENTGCGIDCDSSTIIMNNMISGNTGCGIGCTDSSATITNNIISKNAGNGIVCSYSSPTISNNTISENIGFGIYCILSSSMVISNSILWDNSASTGLEIWIEEYYYPSTLTISYADVKGGQSSVYLDTGCTLNWGPGMIDSDPFFVDPSDNDFHLTFNSPCRGSGDNSAVNELYDFEGDPRVNQGTADMGADEFYTHLYWTGDATPGGDVEVKFVGLPGTAPLSLCIGTGVLDPPIPTMWGDWFLKFPILGPVNLGKIPSPDGVLIIPAVIPASAPPPYSIPMQALVGAELSNPCVIQVDKG